MKYIILIILFTSLLYSSCSEEKEIETPVTRNSAKDRNQQVIKNKEIKQVADFVVSSFETGLFEIELNKLAIARASTRTVKEFAAQSLNKFKRFNLELKQLSEQKGILLPEVLHEYKQTKLNGLKEKKGIDFDKEYLGIVESNLKDNIEKFRPAAQYAKDPEIRYWAGEHFSMLELQLIQAEECLKRINESK